MSISLAKGSRISLTQEFPALQRVTVGLGWDVNTYSDEKEFDLDASIFLLDASGRVSSDDDLVFYNNLTHKSESVIHLGDNRTGAGDGDDEKIRVDLNKIPHSVDKLTIVITIFDAENRKQNFGQVENAYVRLIDATNGTELLKYDLTEDYSTATSMVMGEIYRAGDGWKFRAVGSGLKANMYELCTRYGVSVEG